jgi:hypothetical protein
MNPMVIGTEIITDLTIVMKWYLSRVTMNNNKGSLLTTVYISKNREAWSFSGWYPNRKTIKVIGITLSSKKI